MTKEIVKRPDSQASSREVEFSKAQAAGMWLLLIAALMTPSLILHFSFYTLPGLISGWLHLGSPLLDALLPPLASFIVSYQLITLSIKLFFRMGGPIMLAMKVGLFFGVISACIRYLF